MLSKSALIFTAALAFLAISFVALSEPEAQSDAATAANDPIAVRVRFFDAASDRPCPAMVCLESVDDGSVRLPPDGRKLEAVSHTRDFYRGVEYDADDPNWTGPVRMMSGRGDNDDRSFVYEDRRSIASWKHPSSGRAGRRSRRAPPGRYTLAARRGIEYVPVEVELVVEKGTPLERDVRFERWIDLSQRGWYSGDVHVHHPTLKKEHREYLLAYAEASDLHVVNVLEMGHHQGTDFKQQGFGKEFRERRGDYCLVSGQEEPRSTFGHIIGLNTTGLARDLATYDFYDLAFERLRAQKQAVVGYAHFGWNGCALPRGFPWYVTTEEVEFIEVLQFNLLNEKDYYEYLNLGFRLAAAAGSDIPWGSTLGEVRTYVYTGGESLDIDAWFEGLRRGRSFVTNGPVVELLVDGELPGSDLERKPGDRLKVRARALGDERIGLPSVLEVVSGDGVVRRVERSEGGEGELATDFELPIERSGWLVASTRSPNGTLAHTSPVYVTVGGRPTWSPNRGPAIVEKQLRSIAEIEEEFSRGDDARSRGIRERLERAKRYYAELLEAMRAATG